MIHPTELGDAEVEAWRAIQARADLTNPFLSPEFAQAVGRHRADARVAILEEDQGPVGFFAFERKRLGVGKPIGGGLNDCQAVVHEPGLEWTARDLVRRCGLATYEFDHLVADQVGFAPHCAVVAASPVMDLSRGFEQFCAAVSIRSRGWLPEARRGIRRLERLRGPVRLAFDDPDPEAHRLVQAWKSRQYRRSGRRDPLSRAWVAHLLADLLTVRSETFRCVCTTLYAGDRPVAGNIDLHSPYIVAGWISSYDPAPEIRRTGPGRVCDLLLAEDAAGRGIMYIDLGKGDSLYKRRVGNGATRVAEGCVDTSSPTAFARRAGRWPMRATRAFVLRNPPVRSAVRRGLRVVGGFRV